MAIQNDNVINYNESYNPIMGCFLMKNTALKVSRQLGIHGRTGAEHDQRQQIAFCRDLAIDDSRPHLVMSKQRLRENAQRFMTAMPRVRPHFAVKSNPHQDVLRSFKDEGVHFEIASSAELDALMALGCSMDTVFYSNPIKCPTSIRYAASKGVLWYAVDSVEEVQKIADIKPDAKLYIRTEVSNEGSTWPLAGKFGANTQEIDDIISCSKSLAMQLCGVTFHVGSQCNNKDNWVSGIRLSKTIFDKLIKNGFVPELLNLGGGYPLQLTGDEPTIEEIGAVINKALESVPEHIQIMAEPGRFLVGSAGCLLSQVVGIASRGRHRWLYLDTGVYGGLLELSQNFPARIFSDRKGEQGEWTLAGPTCDAIDVLGKHQLPANMQVEDRVYVPNMGAYSTSCSTEFNGFPAPAVAFVD